MQAYVGGFPIQRPILAVGTCRAHRTFEGFAGLSYLEAHGT